MQQNKNTAAVDTDFINHIVEANITDERLIVNITAALDALHLNAVVNSFVFKYEVPTDNRTKLLFDEKIFGIIEEDYIFNQNEGAKKYYIYLIEELYRIFKGSRLPMKGEAILNYWPRKHSLGEIHSIAMCAVCKFGIFLSDDRDSRHVAAILQQRFNNKIKVHNRDTFFEKVDRETDVHIPRSERRKLTHKPT